MGTDDDLQSLSPGSLDKSERAQQSAQFRDPTVQDPAFRVTREDLKLLRAQQAFIQNNLAVQGPRHRQESYKIVGLQGFFNCKEGVAETFQIGDAIWGLAPEIVRIGPQP